MVVLFLCGNMRWVGLEPFGFVVVVVDRSFVRRDTFETILICYRHDSLEFQVMAWEWMDGGGWWCWRCRDSLILINQYPYLHLLGVMLQDWGWTWRGVEWNGIKLYSCIPHSVLAVHWRTILILKSTIFLFYAKKSNSSFTGLIVYIHTLPLSSSAWHTFIICAFGSSHSPGVTTTYSPVSKSRSSRRWMRWSQSSYLYVCTLCGDVQYGIEQRNDRLSKERRLRCRPVHNRV